MTDKNPSVNDEDSKGIDTEPFIQKGANKAKVFSKNDKYDQNQIKITDKDTKFEIEFRNKKEIEEETKVYRIIMLQHSAIKSYVLVPILSILTAFTILLFAYWSIKFWCALFYTKTTDLSKATHLLITGTRKEMEIIELIRRAKNFQGKGHRSLKEIDVYKSSVLTTPKFEDLSFEFRHSKYYYEDYESAFLPVELNYYKTYECLHQKYSKGVNEVYEYDELVAEYGKCNIVLPEKTVLQLLYEEVLSPFYVFQIVSIIIWFLDEYWQYSVVIIIMYIISIAVEIYDIKRNIRNLRQMVDYECNITVKRIDPEGKVVYREVPSNDLVPGDIILVPERMKMPCDAIQLTGSSIMNEAMLTGESIPVIKNPLPHSESEIYNPEEDKNFTLYSGTEVIQNRKFGSAEVTALVIRTNFDTMKGSLVKSILFPKPSRFSFVRDSMKFVLVMAIISFIGYGIILPPSIYYGLDTKSIIFKGFNLTSTAVPPTLPAAMTVGIAYALSRLRKNKIYCIAPNTINAAGRVKSIVFDKTGTLTEDSLRFSGVTLSSQGTFTNLIEDVDDLALKTIEMSVDAKSTNSNKGQIEEGRSYENGRGESMESLCLECMVQFII